MTELFAKGTQVDALLFARPIPLGLVIAALAAIVVAVILLYRGERGLKLGWSIGLAAARIAVLLGVLLMLAEPVATITQTRQTKPSLAVLVDQSTSMSVKDHRKRVEDVNDAAAALGYAPLGEAADAPPVALNTRQRDAIAASTRLDLATNLVTQAAAPMFDALRADLNVRYYGFGQTLRVLGDSPAELTARPPTAERVEGTALAGAIKEAADAYADGSLSGIVLLSDGLETGNRQPEAVARDLGLRGIPLYVVPMGVPDPDDVSIRNVVVQDVAFVGDTVPVRVQLRSKGYERRSADVTLRFNNREVARENVVLAGGSQNVELYFDAMVGSKGAATLEIAIEPFADEATDSNNTVSRSIRVVNEKVKVLCIEGSARWEFRYLRAILKRDPRIDATFVATRTGNELSLHSSDYIARFPEDPEVAFTYDLVILGDVDATFFTAGELSRLEELVRERGGSLLMLAGAHYSPSSYIDTPVERMLPVRFDPHEAWRDVDKTVHPVLTREGHNSTVLTLENDRDHNDRIWSHVAPLDRLPPLLEARPGATVLATLSDAGTRVDRYPLISWQRYGTGKCMLMATDRLWRLRYRTGDKYHWRVWSQCIQFLTLSRLMGEHKQIRMETDRVAYPVDGQVRIYAEVLDDGYDPVLRERYDVFVGVVGDDETAQAKTRVSLRPDSTRPGLYVGYYRPTAAGRYRIEAGEDDADRANTIEFHAASTSPELADADTRIDLLNKLAELSGGRTFRLAQAGALADVVDPTPRQTTVRREVPLWDNGLLGALIIGFAGFEWFMRRKHDLL